LLRSPPRAAAAGEQVGKFQLQDAELNRPEFNAKVWKPAIRATGIEDSRRNGMHVLRHAYASVLLDAGESIKALSRTWATPIRASRSGSTRTFCPPMRTARAGRSTKPSRTTWKPPTAWRRPGDGLIIENRGFRRTPPQVRPGVPATWRRKGPGRVLTCGFTPASPLSCADKPQQLSTFVGASRWRVPRMCPVFGYSGSTPPARRICRTRSFV
jgi:hypothetical protein